MIDHEQLRIDTSEKVAAFLPKRHPYCLVRAVHEKTGIAWKTIEKWFERGSTPSSAHFLVLIEIYGPEFLIAVIDDTDSWLRAAAIDQRDAQLRARVASSLVGAGACGTGQRA